jgi:hypothetical protein
MARPKAKAEPALGRYNEKRDFTRTSEPSGKAATGKTARRTGKDVGLS